MKRFERVAVVTFLLLSSLSAFARPAAASSLLLTKTVGVAAGCATTDEITVTAGTVVNYCYQVQNTGYTTLTGHTLDDDVLGILVGPNMLQNLAPGEVRTEIFASPPINATVVNTAVWSALTTVVIKWEDTAGSAPVPVASATDRAKVNVLETADACNDQIDNDVNGLTDCQDPSCEAEPFCRTSAPVIGPTGLLAIALALLVLGSFALGSRRSRL
jgi:hypothetical protein